MATLFFDMDGVLVKHTTEDYLGDDPKFLKPGYFAGLKPDPLMPQVLDRLLDSSNYNEISLLTKLHEDKDIFKQQQIDKHIWIDKYLTHKKFITICTSSSKAKTFEQLYGRKLTKTDVLIDDYNENLREWVNAGGTAVKYGKGNPKSWEYHSCQHLTTVEDIVTYINNLIDNE